MQWSLHCLQELKHQYFDFIPKTLLLPLWLTCQINFKPRKKHDQTMVQWHEEYIHVALDMEQQD